MNKENINCPFEPGDIVDCIRNGGNNSALSGGWSEADDTTKGLIVKAIHKNHIRYISSAHGICTMETECGKFLWASTRYYTKVGSKVESEISNYCIF